MKSLCILIALLTPALLIAQAGSLDTEFGGDGIVKFSIEERNTISNQVYVQGDDKILITGSAEGEDDTPNGLVIRYLPDGTLDPGFGHQGSINISYQGYDCYARSSVQLQDGRVIVLVEMTYMSVSAFALFCFHEDGTLDTSFGQQGVTTYSFGSNYLGAGGIVLQPDGKIVIAGNIGDQDDPIDHLYIIRFLSDGSLDIGFGDNGIALKPVGDSYIGISSLLLKSDGKIAVTGYCVINGLENFMVVQYTSAGTIDPSFHQDGIVTLSFPFGDAYSTCAVLQPDDKIVMGGTVTIASGNSEYVAVRFNPDGLLDTSFHEDGINIISISEFFDRPYAVRLQPDGKILLGGFAYSQPLHGNKTCLVRLSTNGYPDQSFDGDGIAALDIGPSSEFIYELAMQHDGKIVATGQLHQDGFNEIFVARFLSGITVGISEGYIAVSSATLYPNPITDYFHLEYHLDRDETITIQLNDLQGRIIQTLLPASSRSAGSHVDNLSIHHTLAPGLYIVTITSVSGRHSIQCLVE